jgi:hypothetical protein
MLNISLKRLPGSGSGSCFLFGAMQAGPFIEFVQFIKTNMSHIMPVELIAPRSELIPDKCKPKIAKSTLAPL